MAEIAIPVWAVVSTPQPYSLPSGFTYAHSGHKIAAVYQSQFEAEDHAHKLRSAVYTRLAKQLSPATDWERDRNAEHDQAWLEHRASIGVVELFATTLTHGVAD